MNLYIHIPFCASKCSYCHFYSVCSNDLIDEYIKALVTEIELRLTEPPSPQITTLYFGGGTPSILSTTILCQILNKLDLSMCSEITLEAHPNTLTPNKIKDYYSLGINRLSIGIQSWNSQILTQMNRSFNQPTLIRNITFAQSIGLTNINLDHIISYPYQTDSQIRSDIKTSLLLNPKHLNLYILERHPHTQIKKSPETTKAIRQFSLAQNLLTQNDFRHYEELSFAKSGFICRHNTDFWQGHDYLGIGVSAVSRIGNTIIDNKSNLVEYIKTLNHLHLPPSQKTILNPRQLRDLKRDLVQRLYL